VAGAQTVAEAQAGLLGACAIVLAGGRSSRFEPDKLAVELDGEPLLLRAVHAVAEVCEEVLVVGPRSGAAAALRPPRLAGLRVIRDQTPFEGPLVALARAAPTARHGRLLLVGGDMPELQPPLLRRLLGWPVDRDGACLVSDGQDQPLPLGLDRAAALEKATGLADAGERSLRALLASLILERIPETEWRALDPDGRSLRDIDRPEDLRDALRMRYRDLG
jgi:molybdopterin-guanine dinucleotide biosynthesis protein A